VATPAGAAAEATVEATVEEVPLSKPAGSLICTCSVPAVSTKTFCPLAIFPAVTFTSDPLSQTHEST
jgi:hypothetical protein